MKKVIRTLLMITCVLGLTACGSDNTVNEFQQSKISQVESMSPAVVEMMEIIAESGTSNEILENYNNIELADWFSYNYTQYTGSSSFACEGKGVRTAINSFISGLETIGEITEVGTPVSEVDDDTIIVTVPITGAEGEGSVQLIFSNDIYFTMSACTLNINETMGQLMARAGLNTLIGMGTVFVVLILISLIISCFGLIPKMQEKFKKKATTPEKAAPAPVQAAGVEEEELSDDTELVAVIAAAIAAYEGTSTDGFRVRSIKRANTKKWQRG